MPLTVIDSDAQFVSEMNNQGVNLVIVDFTATWCGPCRRISPIFELLSSKYPKATFMKVDVDKCQETAASQGVSKMPTFIFYRNKAKLDRLEGADPNALVEKIKHYYGSDDEEDSSVPGMMNLTTFILKGQCEALNESDDHPLSGLLKGSGEYLESDCDPQLIISLSFTQALKIHSIKVKAPTVNGPKTVKLFINQPTTLDFDTASRNEATQELQLSPSDLNGKPVNLRYVKFQNVQNLQVFIKDNQGDDEITRIDELVLYGVPLATTNMSEFKRVAGKAGEAH